MGARFDPVLKRYVGTGPEMPQGEPTLADWVEAAQEAHEERDLKNALSSAPIEIQKVLWEALGRWTPPVPKAAPGPEPEPSALGPILRPKYRA